MFKRSVWHYTWFRHNYDKVKHKATMKFLALWGNSSRKLISARSAKPNSTSCLKTTSWSWRLVVFWDIENWCYYRWSCYCLVLGNRASRLLLSRWWLSTAKVNLQLMKFEHIGNKYIRYQKAYLYMIVFIH